MAYLWSLLYGFFSSPDQKYTKIIRYAQILRPKKYQTFHHLCFIFNSTQAQIDEALKPIKEKVDELMMKMKATTKQDQCTVQKKMY